MAGQGSVGTEKSQFSDTHALRCVHDSAKPDFG